MSLGDLFPPIDTGPTPDPMMVAFVSGSSAMGCFIAGLFFLKFWARTRDRLFLAFAVAFWLLAANSIAPVLMGGTAQAHSEVYLLRLAAFVTIIAAILAKNVRRRP